MRLRMPAQPTNMDPQTETVVAGIESVRPINLMIHPMIHP